MRHAVHLRIRKGRLLLCLLLGGGAASAASEVVFDTFPRRTFIGINGVAARNQIWPWGMEQVESLTPVLLADDEIDATERRLLDLWSQPSFTVRIVAIQEPGFDPADIVLEGSFTSEARAVLAQLRPPEGRELRALWLRTGGAGWSKLVHFAAQSDAQREEVLDVIGERLGEAWADSTPESGYQPFRGVLSSLAETAGLPEDAEMLAQARALLLEACERLDAKSREHDNRRIPGFLYRWLRAPAE